MDREIAAEPESWKADRKGKCLTILGHRHVGNRESSGSNQMELDFVLDLLGESTVIEVKSGKGRTSPSISKVGKVFDIDRRIMFENGNIHVDEDGLEHYPLFAAAFIDLMERGWDGPSFWTPSRTTVRYTCRMDCFKYDIPMQHCNPLRVASGNVPLWANPER